MSPGTWPKTPAIPSSLVLTSPSLTCNSWPACCADDINRFPAAWPPAVNADAPVLLPSYNWLTNSPIARVNLSSVSFRALSMFPGTWLRLARILSSLPPNWPMVCANPSERLSSPAPIFPAASLKILAASPMSLPKDLPASPMPPLIFANSWATAVNRSTTVSIPLPAVCCNWFENSEAISCVILSIACTMGALVSFGKLSLSEAKWSARSSRALTMGLEVSFGKSC